MALTMYDSVEVSHLPASAQAVAGYVDGDFANWDELTQRFPHAHKVSIAVTAGDDAECLDIENGDAVPDDAPGWVRRQHTRGVARPIVYANTSTIGEVLAALVGAGIGRDEYRVWTAHYTGVAHIEPGSDATQYENDASANIDLSLCSDTFFGAPAPAPPKPKPRAPYVPADEVNWEREWDRIATLRGVRYHLRRVFLKSLMVHRERKLVALATSKPKGWMLLNRKARYEKLFVRTGTR